MAEQRYPERSVASRAGNGLAVRGLTIRYEAGPGSGRPAELVRDVSFDVGPGEIVCLVGESGSGKTLTGRAITGLQRHSPRLRADGTVTFGGRELTALPERELRRIRGGQIGMIFQDPVAALDPVVRVGDQIAEAITAHSGAVTRGTPGRPKGRAAVRERVVELLGQVGITDPGLRARQFPHELSGGMCQRVLIAIALAGDPQLLIADEPTTALDVTIQAQVLDLIGRLRAERGLSVLLITHDMGVAARLADRVVVMYAGSVVEVAPVAAFFDRPGHPYSLGLVQAVPRVDAPRARRLPAIPGSVPEATGRPAGCPFQARCPLKTEVCEREQPPLAAAGPPPAAGEGARHLV
ncbi:MAG TPA: ABC transporter ATP-binding protein, partial [Trebonia sp.]|nr:ABC transporter ATP-binding protein [Trebonia sp.]